MQNVRNAAQPRNLNIFSFQPECAAAGPALLAPPRHERHNYNTASRSMSAQGDAGGSPVSVIAVGAICSASASAAERVCDGVAPDESCLDTSIMRRPSSSAAAARRSTGGLKPDISGDRRRLGLWRRELPDAVLRHVGGGAARRRRRGAAAAERACLISGATGAPDPATARGRLRNLLVSSAAALSDAPPDNVFGAGLADAFAAVQKTLPVYGGPASLVLGGNTSTGATLTPAQLGFTDPDSCPITRLSWTGGCESSPAASLSCPFGPVSLKIAASNNGVSFSDPSPLDLTVTNFAVGALPGEVQVDAGRPAQFQVSLTPVGGPFPSAIALACTRLPAGTACNFDSPTVTPGGDVAQVNLTITTTARSAASAPAAGMDSHRASDAAGRSMALWAALGFAIAAVLAGGLIRRRPRIRVAHAAGGLGAAALAATYIACGGGGSNPTPSDPAVSLAPASISFGNTPLQSSSTPQTVTLTNTGAAALTISSIVSSGDFSDTTTCGGSVAAKASCTIAVTFSPTASGARSGALTISDNAAGSPHVVALAGTGTSQPGGTPAGIYQIDVLGTSGNLVQSSVITLRVQ